MNTVNHSVDNAPQRGGRQIAQGVATQEQTLGGVGHDSEPRRGVQNALRPEPLDAPPGLEVNSHPTQGLPSSLGLHPGLSAGCPSGAKNSPPTGWQPALPGTPLCGEGNTPGGTPGLPGLRAFSTFLRQLVGIGSYEAYCRHMAEKHPDATPLSQAEFVAEAAKRRHDPGRPGRCPC
ncbi:MAG: putative Selenoprotein [Verrucomicrobiota bacterium]|jgi:uncharacterized short protein YbdD (DUF466 family)